MRHEEGRKGKGKDGEENRTGVSIFIMRLHIVGLK